MLLGQTVSGAAGGMAEAKARKDELEAAMERDKLYIASKKTNLSGVNTRSVLPSISAFTERPKWEMPQAGLLAKT
jgi:hypothetical protein